MRRLAAEALGTFALVFAGTGAVVINDVNGHTLDKKIPMDICSSNA
ncbi:MAG TPA: hypothetical protein VKA46_36790 [Gemmataceae bacterium]|nr:hypothetical protein [Gemmataceae bacterium]